MVQVLFQSQMLRSIKSQVHALSPTCFTLQCSTTIGKQSDLVDNDCDGLIDEELKNLKGILRTVAFLR